MTTAAAISSDKQQFLLELEATWARAARAAGGAERFRLSIGPHHVELCFAGPLLARIIGPAFAHLRQAEKLRRPLTVHVWDSESTGTVMPPPPWAREQPRFYGEVPELCGEHVYGSIHPQTNALSVIDAQADQAFFWARSAAQLEQFEGVPPLLSILCAWLGERDVQLAHAGAVGTPDGCALLVGKNGSGKSSSALACLLTDLQVLGDDYCAIGPGAQPTVFSLYSASKVHLDTLERMPFLAPMVMDSRRSTHHKALLYLHQHRPHAILANAPLRAIVVPRITGESRSTIRPASPRAALKALAPSTMIQLPARSEAALRRLGEIVRAVPCYELDAGHDPSGVGSAIASVLGV